MGKMRIPNASKVEKPESRIANGNDKGPPRCRHAVNKNIAHVLSGEWAGEERAPEPQRGSEEPTPLFVPFASARRATFFPFLFG